MARQAGRESTPENSNRDMNENGQRRQTIGSYFTGAQGGAYQQTTNPWANSGAIPRDPNYRAYQTTANHGNPTMPTQEQPFSMLSPQASRFTGPPPPYSRSSNLAQGNQLNQPPPLFSRAGSQNRNTTNPTPNSAQNQHQQHPAPPHDQSQTPPQEEHNNAGLNHSILLLIEEGRRREAMMMETLTRLLGERQQPPPAPPQPGLNYSIVADLTKSIGTFDGEGGGFLAREWLENRESMANLHRWPENVALQTARSSLLGGAREWYRDNRERVTTWASFKEMFQSTFVTSESYANKWEKMVARGQAKGESLNSYFHSKARACHALRLNIPDTKEQILVGLASKDLCTAMSSMNHTNLEALLLDMISYERIEDQTSSHQI